MKSCKTSEQVLTHADCITYSIVLFTLLLWVNVYRWLSGKFFIPAYLRRYAGTRPLWSGGIYMADPASRDLSGSLYFVNLAGLYFATYAVFSALNIKSDAEQLLPDQSCNAPLCEVDVYGQAGEVLSGGLALSADRQDFFTVNFYDRKIYSNLSDLGRFSPRASRLSNHTQSLFGYGYRRV